MFDKKTEVKIEGMSCGHCTAAVEEAIGKLPGVKKVKASVDAAAATIKHDGTLALDAVKAAVEEAGFTFVG